MIDKASVVFAGRPIQDGVFTGHVVENPHSPSSFESTVGSHSPPRCKTNAISCTGSEKLDGFISVREYHEVSANQFELLLGEALEGFVHRCWEHEILRIGTVRDSLCIRGIPENALVELPWHHGTLRNGGLHHRRFQETAAQEFNAIRRIFQAVLDNRHVVRHREVVHRRSRMPQAKEVSRLVQYRFDNLVRRKQSFLLGTFRRHHVIAGKHRAERPTAQVTAKETRIPNRQFPFYPVDIDDIESLLHMLLGPAAQLVQEHVRRRPSRQPGLVRRVLAAQRRVLIRIADVNRIDMDARIVLAERLESLLGKFFHAHAVRRKCMLPHYNEVLILQKKIKKGVFVNDSMKITNIYQIKKLLVIAITS